MRNSQARGPPGYRRAMSKYSDSLHRPVGTKRLLVDVQHRLSRDEVRRAFVYYVTVLAPDTYLGATPYAETLSHNLYVVLWLHGSEFLIPRGIEEPQPHPEPSAEALDYAERCTARLWASKRIVERPDGNVPELRSQKP